MTDASGSSYSETGSLRTAVSRIVDSVGVSEWRRVALAVGVPLLFWLVVEFGANLGFLPLAVAVGLGAYLYTRETARETLAASAHGTGLAGIAVFPIEVYRTVAGGSTASVVDTAIGLSGWLVAGVVLVAFGTWLRRSNL